MDDSSPPAVRLGSRAPRTRPPGARRDASLAAAPALARLPGRYGRAGPPLRPLDPAERGHAHLAGVRVAPVRARPLFPDLCDRLRDPRNRSRHRALVCRPLLLRPAHRGPDFVRAPHELPPIREREDAVARGGGPDSTLAVLPRAARRPFPQHLGDAERSRGSRRALRAGGVGGQPGDGSATHRVCLGGARGVGAPGVALRGGWLFRGACHGRDLDRDGGRAAAWFKAIHHPDVYAR